MHVPVLKNESLQALNVHPGEWYIDGTFGRGGHTAALLEAGAKVVAFDLDHEAITFGQEAFRSAIEAGDLQLIHGNFAHLTRHLKELEFNAHQFAGAFFDLGMSSNQLEESHRGFSFQEDEPLDMRMNTDLGVTAADLINALPETHLKSLFWDYSQETAASAIARAIVQRRQQQPFQRTKELADLVAHIKGGRQPGSKLHPATKVFMALRMAVNTELDNLAILLDQISVWLAPGARLAFLSFHEGEDRLVKQHFRTWEKAEKGVQITKKPIGPTDTEIKHNPRSRSAKLRVFELANN